MSFDFRSMLEIPAVRGLILFAASFAAAFLVNLIFCRGLLRLALKTKTSIDEQIVRLLRLPVYLTMILIGLVIGLRTAGVGGAAISLAGTAVRTLIVVIWGYTFARSIRIVLRGLSRERGGTSVVQARTLPLFENLAFVFIFGAALYLILVSWRVDVTAWVASAGVVGIAIGFAAKDTLSNLFAGIFIIADAPYKLGDFVVLGTGERGMVTDIGLRSTRILTRDDIEVIIPNAVIGNATIVNESAGKHVKQRIRIRVSVAYGTDVEQTREILLAAASPENGVCESPEPRVRFREFGDSGLRFELLAWIPEPVLQGKVIDRLNSDVYRRFREEGIEIPFPKRDVYIRNHPPATAGPDRTAGPETFPGPPNTA